MGNEFWAAVIGAIVGSVTGGLIAWLLQFSQDRRQLRQRNQALARSLIFKLIRIHSDLQGFRTHVEECDANANRDGLPIGWQSLRAIGNLPELISFTPEEMSYLLSLNDDSLLDRVLSLDVVHSSTIGIFRLYKERRLALTDALSATLSGMVGTTVLNADEKAFFDPKAAELDLLVSDIRDRVERDARESREALEATNIAIKDTLGHSFKLDFTHPSPKSKS